MTVIAEFTLPADGFPLGSIFDELPDVTVELERVVPTNRYLVPYVWVRRVETDDVRAAFGEHPAVKDISLVDSVDGEYLFRVEWDPEHRGMLGLIADTEVALLSASGTSEAWTFELRAADQGTLSTFQQRAREDGLPLTLSSFHRLSSTRTGQEYDLTDTQFETLLLASERGYFDTPRKVTLEDLGEELGISRQAVASRLRRGTDRLVNSTLRDPP